MHSLCQRLGQQIYFRHKSGYISIYYDVFYTKLFSEAMIPYTIFQKLHLCCVNKLALAQGQRWSFGSPKQVASEISLKFAIIQVLSCCSFH